MSDPSAGARPGYRPEIDGLRALAVVPVILYHAGVPGFRGGFLGVDVFFVLSGYLITGILRADLEAGRFSLGAFYERRARRILPALFGTALLSAPFAAKLLATEELEHYARSLVAVALFGSNLYFWQTTDYFAPASERMPLLHTWSLAVEEQYYLLFPLLLAALHRAGPRWMRGGLWAMLLVSLGAAQGSARVDPVAGYYLLPTRGWELLIGSLLALRPPARGAEGPAALGLALLLGSVFLLDDRVPHPSLWTLPPLLGTALLVHNARAHTRVGRLLATRPLVAVGLASYSAYLVHQPLLALWRVARPGAVAPGALCLAVAPLAWLSWRFVEQPLRHAALPRAAVLRRSAYGLVLVAVLGGLLVDRARRGSGLSHDLVASMQRTPRRCFDLPDAATRPDWLCPLGPAGPPRFLVLGDSHLIGLYAGLEKWAADTGTPGAWAGAGNFPPLLGVYPTCVVRERGFGAALAERAVSEVRAGGIPDVVLASRWTHYTDGMRDGLDLCPLASTPDGRSDRETGRALFAAALERTVAAYVDAGARVHLLRQVPEQTDYPGPIYQAALLPGGRIDPDVLRARSTPRAAMLELRRYTDEVISRVAAAHPGEVDVVDLLDDACDADTCMVGDAQASWFSDRGHLSDKGALRLAPALAQQLHVH